MIDATKLVGGEYWIHCLDDNSWRVARYRHGFKDFTTPQHDYEISELTDAIPIPLPETLAEMWEVIERVGGVTELEQETYDLARKLLEQRT